MIPLFPVQVEGGVDVGAVFIESLEEAHMTHKDAWMPMRVTEGDFSNALAGRRSLDLWKMRELPWRFWAVFIPKFGRALLRQHFVDLQRPYRMLRAELREEEKERSA